ncbi:YciC family protein [uncultured Phenylobacterium sp.]|uniref:YciC family protein n=1 Tax=uncultured Phenylobacterium sp. TaxID=349273 RepID=UPI0025D790D7|nr:YciC family protein [uncultured Phenylobacterium sp.]
MTMETAEAGRFDIARVIQQTFAVLGRNIVTFGILGIVLTGIPTAILGYFQFGMAQDMLQDMRGGSYSFPPGMMSASFLGGLAGLITTAILQGALIHATVQDLNSQPQSVGASLAVGLRNFLSLIVVTILLALGIALGMVLLIVPGVMLACAWCVAVPALVADRTGIFGAFSRSAELTRGNRWQIFGLIVIVVIVQLVLGWIVNLITGAGSIGMSSDPLAAASRALTPLALVLAVIQQVIGSVIGATALAVIYVELRRAHEGEPTGWLADIFR